MLRNLPIDIIAGVLFLNLIYLIKHVVKGDSVVGCYYTVYLRINFSILKKFYLKKILFKKNFIQELVSTSKN